MSQKSFSLKYGKGELAFSLPSEQVACEVLGREYPPIEDVSSAIRQALAHPIDSPPLRELVRPGETVVITVSDITRAWQNMDQVLPLLLDELNLADNTVVFFSSDNGPEDYNIGNAANGGVGNTGYSDGNHLHFEIIYDGVRLGTGEGGYERTLTWLDANTDGSSWA